MWYCDTDELPAIRSGKTPMKHADDEVFHLCEKLESKIKAIKEEGEITLRVQHGWVASIRMSVVEILTKLRTVD
jgi:hypothetical protein